MIKMCKICGNEKEVYCKGLCQKCYNKEYCRINHDRIELQTKEYRKKNSVKIVQRVAEWRKKNPGCRRREYLNNQEKNKERSRKWAKENKERINKRNREWARKNPEKKKAQMNRYKARNPERFRFMIKTVRFRRRLKLNSVYNIEISKEEIREIINRDRVCVYCGCKTYTKGEEGFIKEKEQTIDHIIPIENYGTNQFNNLVLACVICNSSKGIKDVFEWCDERGIRVPYIVIKLLNKQKEQITLGGNVDGNETKRIQSIFERDASKEST